MWVAGRLRVHEIYSWRLPHRKVSDSRSIYKILLVVIWLGVTGLKKTVFVCFLDLFGRRGRERVVRWCELMCGVLYGSCVDTYGKFTYGEYGYFMGRIVILFSVGNFETCFWKLKQGEAEGLLFFAFCSALIVGEWGVVGQKVLFKAGCNLIFLFLVLRKFFFLFVGLFKNTRMWVQDFIFYLLI